MARSHSILVFTLVFLVAPCASLKMKTEEGLGAGKVPNAVNCEKSSYYGMYSYGTKTCYIYHHYTTTDDGQPSSLPEKDGFMDTEFKIDALSDTIKWKIHINSWSKPGTSSFMAETADGSDHNTNCQDAEGTTSDWGTEKFLSHCVNGATWQAARWVERSFRRIKEAKHALKTTKKSISSYKKAASVVGKKWRDDTKEKMKGLRDQLEAAQDIMEKSREWKEELLEKKLGSEHPKSEEKGEQWQNRLDKMAGKKKK